MRLSEKSTEGFKPVGASVTESDGGIYISMDHGHTELELMPHEAVYMAFQLLDAADRHAKSIQKHIRRTVNTAHKRYNK